LSAVIVGGVLKVTGSGGDDTIAAATMTIWTATTT
jgi:hypothetical protein